MEFWIKKGLTGCTAEDNCFCGFFCIQYLEITLNILCTHDILAVRKDSYFYQYSK